MKYLILKWMCIFQERESKMNVELFINQRTQGNSYVVDNGKDCYVVDPGGYDMSSVIRHINEKGLNLLGILLTHGHYDHIIGIPEIIDYKDVPVYISEKDHDFLYDSTLSLSIWLDLDFKLSRNVKVLKLKENDEIFGFKVIETPGHTHGGVCFYSEKEAILLSGDTIFKMNYGRTDLPTGSMTDLKNSIKKLLKLPADVVVYPGHGGTTKIGQERKNY